MLSVSRHRVAASISAALVAMAALPCAVEAAAAPPRPTGPDGKRATVLATGIPTPLAFAFLGSHVFVAAAGYEDRKGPKGGLYEITGKGKAVHVPGLPPFLFGVTQHNGVLYASTGSDLVSFQGFDGTRFKTVRTVYAGTDGFPGFNGPAVGPDGRLWAGTFLQEPKYDHAKDPRPYAQSVVSLGLDGQGLRTEATGIRQPFGIAFAAGSAEPFVTSLGQDTKNAPPDAILHVAPGQDYGFPGCTLLVASACTGFAKPFITLPKHASPVGLAAQGSTLFAALFNGLKGKPQVVSFKASGSTPIAVMNGFPGPVSAVGVHDGVLYCADMTGTVYRVRAP